MIKTSSFTSALCLAITAFASCPSEAAILMATDQNATNQAHFDANISTTDLINIGSASLDTFNASKNANFSTDGAHDGNAVGNSGLGYWGSGDNQGGGIYTVTLTYTLTGSATGYDITSINTIHGWGDSAERHLAQRYDVQITTTSNATFQTLYSVVFDPYTAGHGGATQVTLTNSGGGALQEGALTATGVTGIQFIVYNDPGGSEVGVIREYDVIGTATIPEPSAVLIGSLGILFVLRRKRS